MRSIRLFAFLLVAFPFAVPSAATGTIAAIPNMPFLNCGSILGVSADGSTAAGTQLNSNGIPTGFYFKNGTLTVPPFTDSYHHNLVYASNGDGTAFAGAEYASSDAWIYRPASGHTVVARNGAQTALSASGAYSAGFVSGGYSYPNVGAYRYDATGAGVALGDAVTVTGVSEDGSIVTGSRRTTAGGYLQPYAWRVGASTASPLALSNSSLVSDCQAYGVSANGAFAVGSGSATTNGAARAYRWDLKTNVALDLGSLSGDFGGIAKAASADGSVVVGDSMRGAVTSTAFLWTATGGMTDLYGLLKANGTDLTDWGGFYDVTGVSADGNVVVGHGYYKSVPTSFIARIRPAAAPEPGPVAAVAAGLLVALRRRRRSLNGRVG